MSGTEQREREFFDRLYAEQAYHPLGWRLRMERDAELLLAERGGRLGVVESFGCGDGAFELMLARHAEHVTGVDLSEEAVALANRRAREAGVENVRFVCASAVGHRSERPVDLALAISFLHHVPAAERPAFLTRVRDSLAPGGLFYALEPHADGLLRRLGRRAMGGRYHVYHSPDEIEFTADELRAELAAAGFGDVELRPLDWTLIPATFALARRAGWPLRLCAAFDRAMAGFAPAAWATGYGALARPAAGARA